MVVDPILRNSQKVLSKESVISTTGRNLVFLVGCSRRIACCARNDPLAWFLGGRRSPYDWLEDWKTGESPNAGFRQFFGRKTSIHDHRR
jgi:hypothetical protein